MEYMCQRKGVMDGSEPKEALQSTSVILIGTVQPREKAAVEMQLGELQIRFNESPGAEQLKIVMDSLMGANKPVC